MIKFFFVINVRLLQSFHHLSQNKHPLILFCKDIFSLVKGFAKQESSTYTSLRRYDKIKTFQ